MSKPKNKGDKCDTEPTIDPMVLERVSPLSALYFLSRRRLLSLLGALDDAGLNGDEDAGKLVSYSAFKLINPLLLASAVSMSIVKKQDYQSLLTDYVCGFSPDFDQYLLKVPEFVSQEELERFLVLEEEYVQALRLLPLQLMLLDLTTTFINDYQASIHMQWLKFLVLPELITPEQREPEKDHRLNSIREMLRQTDPSPFHTKHWEKNVFLQTDPSPFLSKRWEQLKFCIKLEDKTFDIFDVLYVAWIIFNPIHLLYDHELSIPLTLGEQLTDFLCRTLVGFSYTRNSAVHNTRDYYKYEFERLKGLSNSILKSNLSKVEKKASLIRIQQQLTNAPKLIKRAYRFYEWLPHEITTAQKTREFWQRFFREEGQPIPYFNYGE